MRLKVTAAVVFWVSIGSFAQAPQPKQPTRLSQIAAGALSGNTYTNHDLGIGFQVPHGWPAKVNPQIPLLFNPSADAIANRCTRVLLEFDSRSSNVGGSARGVVFAIDPECLGVGPFPTSEKDKARLAAFNSAIFAIYEKSAFFPPGGVQLYATRGSGDQSRLFLSMTGVVQVRAPEGDGAVKREPVSMNTLFALVDLDKFWVGWATVADDSAKETLTHDSSFEVLKK
jgi:hypothetical protein